MWWLPPFMERSVINRGMMFLKYPVYDVRGWVETISCDSRKFQNIHHHLNSQPMTNQNKTFTQLVAEHDAKVRKSIERKKKPKSKKK